MSKEDQIDFDNWEEEAQSVIKQQQLNKAKLAEQAKVDKDALKQQQQQPKKQDIKQTLKQKINQYAQLTPQQFSSRYAQSKSEPTLNRIINIGGGKVLKQQKDFIALATLVSDKLSEGIDPDKTIEDDFITTFFQELTIYLYNGLQWANLFQVQKKIKVVKNGRKEDQKRKQKEKNKKKKQEEQLSSTSKIVQKTYNQDKDNKPKDDLFGGVATISSKQEQEQRKKQAHKTQQQQAQKTKQVNQDDDDFM